MVKLSKIMLSIYRNGAKIVWGSGVGRLPGVRPLNNFIISHIKPDFVELEGNKLFLDANDTLGLSIFGTHEKTETEFAKKQIKKGDVVLDIGANIGYYTLIFARAVGNKGKVFAFEPDPENFALLEKNVKINRYANVVLVKKAVSSKTGKLKLYADKNNKTDGRIYDSHDNRSSIDIDAVRLDDYFANYKGNVDFIKLDIQGAEWAAVTGMARLLKRNKKVKIITEFWPAGLKRFGVEPGDYLKLFVKNGFRLYELKEGIEAVNFLRLLEKYTPEKQNYTNLFCTRERLA
ncbi:FkbM family methyltransferase [Candidatus Micrarchaeota archaeon]|nr:FkbM family methyltransferase [Candidatus Micrarchaeota archaeon]